MRWANRPSGVIRPVPIASDDRIVYPAALVDRGGEASAAAAALLDFLASEEAGLIFDAHGFVRPAP